MANEVVKYHNDLNTVPMRNWTAEEMDFFFSILVLLCKQLQNEEKYKEGHYVTAR